MASCSESGSDESGSDDQIPEMLATTRERRANAGNRMARLLENFEDNDDFYKSTYGGFFEVTHGRLVTNSVLCVSMFRRKMTMRNLKAPLSQIPILWTLTLMFLKMMTMVKAKHLT